MLVVRLGARPDRPIELQESFLGAGAVTGQDPAEFMVHKIHIIFSGKRTNGVFPERIGEVLKFLPDFVGNDESEFHLTLRRRKF